MKGTDFIMENTPVPSPTDIQNKPASENTPDPKKRKKKKGRAIRTILKIIIWIIVIGVVIFLTLFLTARIAGFEGEGFFGGIQELLEYIQRSVSGTPTP